MEEKEISKELKKHQETMTKIEEAETIEKIPTITVATLAGAIANNTRTKELKRITGVKFNTIAELLIEGNGFESEKISQEMSRIFEEEGIEQDKVSAFIEKLISKEKIPYIIEEVKARDSKISELIQKEHEEVMESIENATRISELPVGLTPVKIAGYLSNNSKIERKGKDIPISNLRELSLLLLDGKQWDSKEVQSELEKIASEKHPNKEDAKEQLQAKLSQLPRLGYFIEEVNSSQEKQKQLIERNCSNVNVYFIPNYNAPIDGGRFYNVYVSRIDEKLDLEEILPHNLAEIISEETDIDEVEQLVREESGDETFKNVGGIILNKDETVGSVSTYRPSDGQYSISPEEQKRNEEIQSLASEFSTIMEESQESNRQLQEQLAEIQRQMVLNQRNTDARLSSWEKRLGQLVASKKETEQETEEVKGEDR